MSLPDLPDPRGDVFEMSQTAIELANLRIGGRLTPEETVIADAWMREVTVRLSTAEASWPQMVFIAHPLRSYGIGPMTAAEALERVEEAKPFAESIGGTVLMLPLMPPEVAFRKPGDDTTVDVP